MPFTLAHPAAVMPLRRIKYLPTIALVVGSVTPDVTYYFPSWAVSATNWFDLHTISGSIMPGIPIGLLMLAIALLLRGPLTALMSERGRWVALREAEEFLARPVNWLLAMLALLVGSWTHILWDGFTHSGTWISRRVEVLSAQVNVFGIYTGEMSHVLQYVSSIVGLLVIAYWYRAATAAASPEVEEPPESRRRRRRMLLLVIVAAIVFGTLHAVRGAHPSPTFYRVIYLLLTRTLAWFMLLYVLAGVVMVLIRRPQPQLQS